MKWKTTALCSKSGATWFVEFKNIAKFAINKSQFKGIHIFVCYLHWWNIQVSVVMNSMPSDFHHTWYPVCLLCSQVVINLFCTSSAYFAPNFPMNQCFESPWHHWSISLKFNLIISSKNSKKIGITASNVIANVIINLAV